MTVPQLNFNLEALLPEIIVAVLAIVVLMLDLFMKGRQKRILTWVSVGGYVLALVVCLVYFFAIGNTPTYAFGTPTGAAPYAGAMLVSDHLAYFFRILAIMTALLGTLFAATYVEERGMPQGEFHAVLALLTLGAMLVGASVDLIMIFLGIELMSISTYILVGFARNDKLSNEGSLKYFLLGTFATAILVYGMAWLFGMTGTTNLPQIAHRLQTIGNGVNSS